MHDPAANSAEQALTRLTHCVLTANVGLPPRSTRRSRWPARSVPRPRPV